MKKRVVLIFSLSIAIILAISFISAAANDTTNVTNSGNSFEKSYSCLRDQIDARTYGSMTIEELAFSLMALGYDGARQGAIGSELENRKSTSAECWPKNGCTIKETSLVMLAYNQVNRNTDSIKNWLMNQTGPTTDLIWYLQIETVNQSTCKITYDNQSRSISISDKKVISGSAGSCLRSAYNGYWLEVSENCYGKEFTVSCSNDFLTSIFYKRKTGSTIFVTSTTQQQSPNGESKQKVESLCFKQSGSCNYEGSLLATTAINKKDSTIKDKIIPYLITLSSDSANKKYLPSAFLYSITAFDEYFSELTILQNSKGYWQISDSTKRYYDTAVALFGLMGRSDSEQFSQAKDYLLDPTVQGTGCWNGNNIRDTAFILSVLDPKISSSSSITKCADYSDQGYTCMASGECDDVNGSQLGNYYCFGGSVCCSKPKLADKTCSEKGGVTCNFGQVCSTGNMVSASGTSLCCLSGTCGEPTPTPGLSDCEAATYTCKGSAIGCDSSTEEEKLLDCPENGKCCAPLTTPPSKSYWWLWLLIILVILVILGIVYRNQVQMWVFRLKSKFSKEPVSSQQRPMQQPMQGMPRQIVPGQMPPRPGLPPRPGMPMRPGLPPRPGMPFPKQKELDETLKKLRDMGNK